MVFVFWFNECWYIGFFFLEWEQGLKEEGKEKVVKVRDQKLWVFRCRVIVVVGGCIFFLSWLKFLVERYSQVCSFFSSQKLFIFWRKLLWVGLGDQVGLVLGRGWGSGQFRVVMIFVMLFSRFWRLVQKCVRLRRSSVVAVWRLRLRRQYRRWLQVSQFWVSRSLLLRFCYIFKLIVVLGRVFVFSRGGLKLGSLKGGFRQLSCEKERAMGTEEGEVVSLLLVYICF